MTALGLVYIATLLACLPWGRRGILVAVALAAPFNDSVVGVFGTSTLTPYYLGIIVYIIVAIAAPHQSPQRPKRWLLSALAAIAVLQAALAPIIFRGIPVVAADRGLDQQVGSLSTLSFSSSGFAQLAYLLLNLIFISLCVRDGLLRETHMSFVFLIGILVASFSLIATSAQPMLNAFFENSPRQFYAAGDIRLHGQFSEPSHLGAFALSALVFFAAKTFTAQHLRQRAVSICAAAMSGLLIIVSSTGTAVAGATLLALLLMLVTIGVGIRNLARWRTTIRAGTMLVIIGGIVGLIIATPYVLGAATSVIRDKGGSSSLINREYSNNIALRIFAQTSGIGVGIGNNRASSLVTMLLSTIGIVGFALVLGIWWHAIKNGLTDPRRRATALALLALLCAEFVSIGDFASPTMWLSISLCYQIAKNETSTTESAGTRRRDSFRFNTTVLGGGHTHA